MAIDPTTLPSWRHLTDQERALFLADFAAQERAAAPAAPDADPAAPEPAEARDAAGRTLRHDGWTPERQRLFLEAIADGSNITTACRIAGMTTASLYAFRRRAGGQAFRLAWDGVRLLARDRVADTLLERALEGQTEIVTRANGEIVERFRYDNRLAMNLLARLDRAADAHGAADAAAAHAVAGELDQYLDLLARDGGAQANARAARFLALRLGGEDAVAGALATDWAPVATLARADRFDTAGAGLAAEVDTADLDLARRGEWTGEQWRRAEAAGLLVVAPLAADADAADAAAADAADTDNLTTESSLERQLRKLDAVFGAEDPVWWDEQANDWRTSFPPPEGFTGDESGDWGTEGYDRELTDAEREIMETPDSVETALMLRRLSDTRDRWFIEQRDGDQQRLAALTAHVEAMLARMADRVDDELLDAAVGRTADTSVH